MSKTTRSMTFNSLLTSTDAAFHKNGAPQDAIFNAIPLLEALRRKKSFKVVKKGGEVIKINLTTEMNSNGSSYAGYEKKALVPQDPHTLGFDQWRQYYWDTSISGLEEFQNSGKAKIFDLLAEKKMNTYMSAQEDLNADLWDLTGITKATGVTGNGGKNINSVPLLVQSVPGTSNVVHNITSSSTLNTWWLNRTFDGSAFTSQKLYVNGIRHAVNTCNRGKGGGSVDMIVFDQNSYELLESALDDKVRYMQTKNASAGFEAINWKGVECIWDIYVPDTEAGANGGPDVTPANGAIYLLNSNCLKLYVGKDFESTPFVDEYVNGQDAKANMMLFYGQLITDNRRKLGVVENCELTLT